MVPYTSMEWEQLLMSDFVSQNISHDIRTPFVGVVTLSNLLANTLQDTEHKEDLQLVSASGLQLLTWFNQIIAMIEVEESHERLHVVPFSPQEAIEGVVTTLRPSAKQKGVPLRVAYSSPLPEKLIGDVLRLQHILLNLITNAITFTQEGSVTVKVQGWVMQAGLFQLEIRVIDTGVGIAPADQVRIFEPFSRLDPAYSVQRPAPGLGLAIAQQLIEDLQGTLGLESALGQGSTFCIRVPLQLAEEASV